MDKLTSRQAEVLALIRRHIDDTGYPPTRADIAQELGFRSANAAEEHLKALARKGAIEIIPGASRGIRLPDSPGLPIIGRVAAGSPILAEEHVEDYCDITPSLFRPAADFFLRVHGESMLGIGICDGDLLAVHNTQHANKGDIVVARIDDEVTVKRYHPGRESHIVELHAENPEFQTITVDLRDCDFAIEGLSVGVLRCGV